MKMLADLQNVGVFQNIGGCTKCWRIYKMLVSSKILAAAQNVGGFVKCWRPAEI
jgi:hypothetical protein